MHEGKMVDASYTVAPRPRNTREENKAMKEGRGDELWDDNPHKKVTKTLMLGGLRKMGRLFTVIRITLKLI
jgi:hypothetical protein